MFVNFFWNLRTFKCCSRFSKKNHVFQTVFKKFENLSSKVNHTVFCAINSASAIVLMILAMISITSAKDMSNAGAKKWRQVWFPCGYSRIPVDRRKICGADASPCAERSDLFSTQVALTRGQVLTCRRCTRRLQAGAKYKIYVFIIAQAPK